MERLFLFLLACNLALTACGSHTTIDHLTVEGRRSGTLGLDEQSPRFGWQIQSKANDVRQQAYRIVVASTADKAKKHTGDVWDSGLTPSDDSQWIEYKGAPIAPNRQYYWCVQVSTSQGETTWSDVATWSSGLLDDANWKGEWIGLDSLVAGEDSQTRHSRLRSRYLRKEFTTAKGKRVQRATAHVSGLGYYAMYLNGERMPQNCLSPAPTDYTKSVIYDTYDVTELVGKDNVIGIILGGGYYYSMTQNYEKKVRTTYGFPCLLMNLIVEYADGTTDTVSTDTTWHVNIDGPIRYSNLYDGMMYDASKELKGWLSPGYDDSAWLTARPAKAPGGKLTGNLLPPVIVYETDKPAWIRQVGDRYIVDFGTNNTGRIVLKDVKLPLGDTLCVRYAELLDKGDTTLYTANMRQAQNTDYFIGNGEQREFTSEFLWHGFRYAEISGVKALKTRNLVRENMADDLATDASITIHDAEGNDMLNRIIDNAYPSWGYMVKNGATTIWELWNGNTANPSMNSGNHVMLLGDLLPWCYEHLAGIRSDYTRNGFKHTVLAPDFSVQQVSGVDAHYPSVHGSIHSNWHRQGEHIVWDIVIPANTTAEAHLPNGEVKQLTSGKHRIETKE